MQTDSKLSVKKFSVQEADSSVTKAAANISQVELNSLNLDGRSSATSGGSTDTDGDGTSDSAMMNADLILTMICYRMRCCCMKLDGAMKSLRPFEIVGSWKSHGQML